VWRIMSSLILPGANKKTIDCKKMNPKLSIAYFVTSHGFGHAARASAVMNAIHARWPFVHFEIFTNTPEWFFKNSLLVSFNYHKESTDIGLVQTSALHCDPDQTIGALKSFLPFDEMQLSGLAETMTALDCLMVVSDISPLGIAAADKAGLSSILVENFTWDWIYEFYQDDDVRFKKYVNALGDLFNQASHRIQAEPVCNILKGQLSTPPISRIHKTAPHLIREKLRISDRKKMVLISMGGISESLPFINQLKDIDDNFCFVLPGISTEQPVNREKHQNIIFLSQNSEFYHPDLVNASDVVIGKVGYSTLAEVYHAGVPYGFITRSDFRESAVFESYIQLNMEGIRIDENDFFSGVWLKQLPKLLALPKRTNNRPNGAGMAAEYICNILVCEKEILDIVDTKGRVIGAAPRKCVHGNNQLLHQVVHVLVFDKENRLLLQKRSLTKRVAPGRWDTSVGGHVDCGESIETAMFREMKEELGIRPESMQFAYQYIHTNDFESELVSTYVCLYDGKIFFNPEEIDAVKFWEMEEINNFLGKAILSDNFEDEFLRYQRWLKVDAPANFKS
jgi:isopentenyl-diphosphate delta-isomerase type 1